MSGGVPVVLEPVGVCRDYGKSTDGNVNDFLVTGLTLALGLYLFRHSNLSTSTSSASWLANPAGSAKIRK